MFGTHPTNFNLGAATITYISPYSQAEVAIPEHLTLKFHLPGPLLGIMSLPPPWLRNIRRRERHRPTADDDDEHLREMFNAARDGDINRLKVALETLAQSREQINISMLHELNDWDVSWTPLHAAVYGGHFDVATLLIALGADLEACEGYMGGAFTPFHLAVKSGNPAMVRLLLDSGANADARWYDHGRQDYGIATFLAIGPGREPEATIEVIDMLLDHGLDINEPSPWCKGNRLVCVPRFYPTPR